MLREREYLLGKLEKTKVLYLAMLRCLEGGVEDDTFNESMNLARKSTRETNYNQIILKQCNKYGP